MPFFPQSDPQQPELVRQIADLRRELRLLQQKADAEDVPKMRRQEITFSFAGAVDTTASPQYLVKDYSGSITAMTIVAQGVGDSDSLISITLNDLEAKEVTLPASTVITSYEDLMIEVEEWDRLAVAFLAVGPNLANVTIHFQLLVSEDSSYR